MNYQYNEGQAPVSNDGNTLSFDDQQRVYFTGQPAHHISHDNNSMAQQNSSGELIRQSLTSPTNISLMTNLEYPMQYSSDWPVSASQMHAHPLHNNLPRDSVQSSTSSNFRTSDDSIFSQHHWRASVASTNTTWSNFSASSREHYIAKAERLLNTNSNAYPTKYAPSQKPTQHASQKRSIQRQTNQTKDQFLTCVSRTERSKPSDKEPKYWCTSCKKGFCKKWDWKRHEETYQERCDTYQCGLCKKTYFLEKDFIHHHRESHRCQRCSDDQHGEAAKRTRRGRTGWGCGFCLQYHTDWTERCNHIAWHFEKNGDTMENWSQSKIIYSLLLQPSIREEWQRILYSKQELNPHFGWSQSWAGRAEGYPDSGCAPQLQDLLEFFTEEQNASEIAEFAYHIGHNGIPQIHRARGSTSPHASHHHSLYQQTLSNGHTVQTRLPSPPDKELPPPPVPPKDNSDTNMAITPNLHHVGGDIERWDNLIETIPEDDILPDSLPLDLGDIDFASSGSHLDPNIHY